ncbi:MAG: TonB C-terminal domain-containing protein [Alphaproteobacteria bacterium]|nr:TonB C-terminal domain-containing protein [Alphaproteobacteria bacterium]
MTPRNRRQRRNARIAVVITWVGVSLFLHVLFFGALSPLWPYLSAPPDDLEAAPLRLVVLQPQEPEEPEEPEKEIDWDGQLVDLPEPVEQEKPKDAEYLAEHDRTVEEETRTRNFRVNPEILTPEYSPDDKLEMEDLIDLGVQEKSQGAKVGNDRFEPDRNGSLAALPSPYRFTNKDGLQAPTAASHSTTTVAGAPNNDLLQEELGDRVNLNTKEFLYASYINQIRRLVNFYWQQNLDNLSGRVVLVKPRYRTVVSVTLTADGGLEEIRIDQECGSPPLDNAVVEAFRIAGPFPPPPEGLLERDGLAYLDNMGFEVQLGQAKAQYMGIDPRAGVQFPGILKSPR